MASTIQKITGLPLYVKNFIFEARDELKKVSWPSRQTTVKYTIVVIVASLLVGVVIGSVDYLFTLLIEQLV